MLRSSICAEAFVRASCLNCFQRFCAKQYPGAIMIAVIFELWPNTGQQQMYFDLATALRSELDDIDGFISIERFESLATPGKYLSLSFWRDEQAVQMWRNRAAHRDAQSQGRSGVLANYRLRVAQVLRDYGLHERAQAPADSVAHHHP
jgi:heme-degrading monooxygenase HmoA